MLAGKSVYVTCRRYHSTNYVSFNPPIEQHNEYRKVNTDIPYELAQLAYQINARVCYTSTDLVIIANSDANVLTLCARCSMASTDRMMSTVPRVLQQFTASLNGTLKNYC